MVPLIFDAVLFDMDGTLVDSDAAVERAWANWANEYGFAPEAAGIAVRVHPGRLDPGCMRIFYLTFPFMGI